MCSRLCDDWTEPVCGVYLTQRAYLVVFSVSVSVPFHDWWYFVGVDAGCVILCNAMAEVQVKARCLFWHSSGEWLNFHCKDHCWISMPNCIQCNSRKFTCLWPTWSPHSSQNHSPNKKNLFRTLRSTNTVLFRHSDKFWMSADVQRRRKNFPEHLPLFNSYWFVNNSIIMVCIEKDMNKTYHARSERCKHNFNLCLADFKNLESADFNKWLVSLFRAL